MMTMDYAGGHYISTLLDGSDAKWNALRVGDHAMVCVDMRSFTGNENKKYKIFVVDFETSMMFESIWGSEGA